MHVLRIAAAQSLSVPGNLQANVSNHCRFLETAAAIGVDLLVFPELSLTGYEPALVGGCCVDPQHPLLSPLRDASRRARMIVSIGAPIRSDTALPHIGAITFFPNGESAVYLKQHLHPSEESFACAARPTTNLYLLPARGSFALAICADTSHATHPEAAFAASASLYTASVLVSEGGYNADAALLSSYAARFNFGVLMANHAGPSGPYVSAGRSAFWSPGGRLVVAAPGPGECIVLASRSSEEWSGYVIAMAT